MDHEYLACSGLCLFTPIRLGKQVYINLNHLKTWSGSYCIDNWQPFNVAYMDNPGTSKVICFWEVSFFLRSNLNGHRKLPDFWPYPQGLPGDGHDCAGTRKCPQNDPWGVVNSSRKKKYIFNYFFYFLNLKKNSLLSHFIHFQLQILPPYPFKCHQM
jgi:hypothetical protein